MLCSKIIKNKKQGITIHIRLLLTFKEKEGISDYDEHKRNFWTATCVPFLGWWFYRYPLGGNELLNSTRIWSHHFMGNRWGNSGSSVRLYFWGLLSGTRPRAVWLSEHGS